MIWSFVLAGVGILGLVLAGDKKKVGWAIGFFAQILWIIYAVVTDQWGFIASAFAYGFVYAANWWRWCADERKEVTA